MSEWHNAVRCSFKHTRVSRLWTIFNDFYNSNRAQRMRDKKFTHMYYIRSFVGRQDHDYPDRVSNLLTDSLFSGACLLGPHLSPLGGSQGDAVIIREGQQEQVGLQPRLDNV